MAGLLLAPAVALAQTPGPGIPAPAWQRVVAAPAFWPRPPAQPEHFVFGHEQQFHDEFGAQQRALDLGGDAARVVVHERLGHRADAALVAAIAETVVARREVVHAACGRFRHEGANGPGQVFGQAWVVWRVPLDAIRAVTPPAHQGRIEQALLDPAPGWLDVAAPPAWARTPPRRPGWLRLATVHEGRLPHDARARARSDGPGQLRARVAAIFGGGFAPPLAGWLAQRAVGQAARAEQAMWSQRRPLGNGDPGWSTSAFVLWDVPLAGVCRQPARGVRRSR